MATLKEIVDMNPCPSTTIINVLSRQIIAEMNNAVPGVLVDFSDLNISIDSRQFPFLQRPAKEALARAIRARGTTLRINSAYRTCAQQFLLRRWMELRKCGIARAALPGKSLHESGLAIDIPDVEAWKPFLQAQGWVHVGANLPGDPFHFEFRGRSIQIIGNIGVQGFQRLWNKNNPNDRIDEDGIYVSGGDTDRCLRISPSEGFNVSGTTPNVTEPATPDNPPQTSSASVLNANADASQTNRILRLSSPLMQGGDVRRVQMKLRQLNPPLLPSDSDVDGFYGRKTEAAIRQFQTNQGITADGVVGSQTYQKLGIT
jgi:hypothetical protein